MKTCPFLIVTIYVEPRTQLQMRRSIANKWWLSVWCYLIEDSPTRLLKSDANPNWGLTTNSLDLCEPGFPLTQSSIRFELANIRFNQLFNKLPTCSWVCSEYIFCKGQDCFLLNFIIFHRASQQRYLRNLTNFRNQANTSRLICYIFLPVCWRIQLRWGKELSKRKRGAFSIQPISILLQ